MCRSLIPDYLNALEEAEARRADLDAQVKAATAASRTKTTLRGTLTPEDLKKLKADLADAKRQVKRLEAEFLDA